MICSKKCSRCGETKPASKEYFTQRKTRLDSWCKTCYVVTNRARVALHPDKKRTADQAYRERTKEQRRAYREKYGREYNARWAVKDLRRRTHRALKREVLEVYGGAVCICCGETEILMLCLDHLDNKGAAHRQEMGEKKVDGKRYLGISLYSWAKKYGYPPIFQVSCMNCNWARHWSENNICPHEIARQQLLAIEGTARLDQAA